VKAKALVFSYNTRRKDFHGTPTFGVGISSASDYAIEDQPSIGPQHIEGSVELHYVGELSVSHASFTLPDTALGF
jgi:hypothetical protein